MNILQKFRSVASAGIYRNFSGTSANNAKYSCQLLVIGGGSGGCAMAAKFARRLRPMHSVIVIEPSTDHYYQPLFTLVGAGVASINETRRSEESCLPKAAKWIRDYAECINAKENCVTTRQGDVIEYEYLVVATGIINDYKKIPGLCEALEDPHSGVSTIFSEKYVTKTTEDLRRFKGGDAIFTYPHSHVKCPGAPLKIAYLTDAFLTRSGVRSKSNISYNTYLPVIFGVKKYAKALVKVAERKNIQVNYHTLLQSVDHTRKEAVFLCRDSGKEVTVNYNLLHVTPAMRTPDLLQSSPDITNEHGYLTVDKYTLQHTKYPNIYGIGDCTDTPNSKTAAAIAKQCWVLEMNLLATMQCHKPKERYDGYGACPLVTSFNTVILAEFLYDGEPHETLPFNQAVDSKLAFYMKKNLFPLLYWNFMVKGNYHGPEFVRKVVNPMGWN